MKQFTTLAVAAAALLLGACAEDSSRPTPKGEGTLRAINAIPTSGEFRLLIEERLIGTSTYRTSTSPAVFDGLFYNFNFETVLPGDNTLTRVATVPLDVQDDTDYTFIISGDLAAPDVALVEKAERDWDGSETVFEIRFGHTAPSLGDVDVYFDPPGTPPTLGNEVASLSFGDISAPLDFEAVEMVLTLTAPGDPATVLFESDSLTLTAATSYFMSTFDTTANDIGPVAVSLFSFAASSGGAIADVNIDPTVRFFHASRNFATADVYIDEPPTNALFTNHAFGDITGDIPVPAGDLALTYTEAGNIGNFLLEDTETVQRGARRNFYVVRNLDDENVLISGSLDRRSVANTVKFFITNTSGDNSSVDVYVVPTGESVDDHGPIIASLPTLFPLARVLLNPNSYDLYLTVPAEKTVLFGPLPFDANLGDVIDVVIYDTVDPAVPDVVIVPAP